jgi:hypothetical protein
MFHPGQAVKDGDLEGIVVVVKYGHVRVWFPSCGVVDYIKARGGEVAAAGSKTTEDLRAAGSMQHAATLLLRLFLSGTAFSVQDGQLSVLETTGMRSMPVGNTAELVDALEIFLR